MGVAIIAAVSEAEARCFPPGLVFATALVKKKK